MTPYNATRGQAGPDKKSSTVATRFAPSPTGGLHLGHAWSALLAHEFARERGGAFLLRIEDIDPGRCREEHVAGILDDLSWLGLTWDGEVVRQSRRLPLYAEALEQLKAMDLVYPCFCTRSAIAAEIAASAVAPHGPNGRLYPGTCRALGRDEREQRLATDPHAWRLDVTKALAAISSPGFPGEGDPVQHGGGVSWGNALTWTDHGEEVLADPAQFGDMVLARKDAPTSYHLAVTVDDAAQGITDIVRGADLRASTHVHRLLQALLGLPTPAYHHHALLTDTAGQRLAKRSGAPMLRDLRGQGVDPVRLADNLRAGILPAGIHSANA